MTVLEQAPAPATGRSREYNRRYCKSWRYRTSKEGKRRIPAGPTVERVRTWVDAGHTVSAIAEATGVARSQITELANNENPTTHRSVARRIEQAQLPNTPVTFFVDATGSQRRLRALIAFGYTRPLLASRLPIDETSISRITNGIPNQRPNPRVHIDTARAITALYRQWALVPGPSTRSRMKAARAGWHGPLAWGADIDDPAARPDTAEPDPAEVPAEEGTTRAERIAEARRLHRRGLTSAAIGARVGVAERTIERWKAASWKGAQE
jgi:transcriptional regulator with XRE-family HTH domain